MLPQRKRLIVLVLNILGLCALSRMTLGGWFPPFTGQGLWFYSGAFAFLAGSLLDAPTHVLPKQVFQFSATALLGVLSAGIASGGLSSQLAVVAFFFAVTIEVATILAGLGAMWWKDERDSARARLARTGVVVGQVLGTPTSVSTVVFLYLLAAFHWTHPDQALMLLLGWVALVFVRPVEHVLKLEESLEAVWQPARSPTHLGTLIGRSFPGIMTVRHTGTANVAAGTPLVVHGDDGFPSVALALNYIGYTDGPWLKALQLELSSTMRNRLSALRLADGDCAILEDLSLLGALDGDSAGAMSKRERLIGVVSTGTDRSTLRFEVVRFDAELREGQLVAVQIGEREVLYQVLNGLTVDEIVQQRNTRGYVMGTASKVGSWSQAAGQFEHVPWVPAPNAPVFLQRTQIATATEGIGVFPGTNYPVHLDPQEVVTHNTAVLGILGVGKTFTTLEIVERILQAGIKVVCLDLTDQYAKELEPYFDASWHLKLNTKLREIGSAGKKVVSKNVEEGGSIRAFETAVGLLVADFVERDAQHQLLVLNPNGFEVWRQDSKPYQDTASMVSLSAAEITRIVSEAALAACQGMGMTTKARCCLVYEEAHSLVPEWGAVAADGDKTASNGSARAILQGRKFGLGCVVVTQRTASITKSILNQCNTIVAMRSYDATGMEFLANYIGKEYAGVLTALPDRHGVVFGRASSCPDPVVVRFNDRQEMLSRVRKVRPPTRLTD